MQRWLILFLVLSYRVSANEYINGTVILNNGESHTGLIRWDEDEETFWSDHFNGEKSEIPGFSKLSDEVKEAIENSQKGPSFDLLSFQVQLSSIFAEDIDAPNFIVPFAAIQSLIPKIISDRKGLEVHLHNGDVFFTHDGSNDVNAKIFVDKADGSVGQFRMDQVKEVNFSTTRANRLGPNHGIYGVVESQMGTFIGRIHWDRDERFGHQTLEGRDQNKLNSEEVSTVISDIKAITRKDDAALFEMKDGSQVLMTGTNDVDNGNRGLYIDTPDQGRLVLPWEQFNKITFTEPVEDGWDSYHQAVKKPGKLKAIVKRRSGTELDGDIIFNMAQSSPAEMIRCTIKGMDIYMPMFMMRSIKPAGDQYSDVTLTDGTVMKVYGSASFTSENLGLLVNPSDQAEYVPWEDVEEIIFNH